MDKSLEDHPYIKELYCFRKVYHATLFNEWAKMGLYEVHKSGKHHDGNLCHSGDMFIVAAKLPSGIISNHYYCQDWGLFKIPDKEKCLFAYDGYLPADVLKRMEAFIIHFS